MAWVQIDEDASHVKTMERDLARSLRTDFISKIQFDKVFKSVAGRVDKEMPDADIDSLLEYLTDRWVDDFMSNRLLKMLMGELKKREGLTELEALKVMSRGKLTDDLLSLIEKYKEQFGKMTYRYVERTFQYFVKDWIRAQVKKQDEQSELGRGDKSELPEHELIEKLKKEQSWEEGLLPLLRSHIKATAKAGKAPIYMAIIDKRWLGRDKTDEDIENTQTALGKEFGISQSTVARDEKDLLAMAKDYLRKHPDVVRNFPKTKTDDIALPKYTDYMKENPDKVNDLYDWVVGKNSKTNQSISDVNRGYLKLFSKGLSTLEVLKEVGMDKKDVVDNIKKVFREGYDSWYKDRTKNIRKAFYMIMNSSGGMDYDRIGGGVSASGSEVDYDHIKDGAIEHHYDVEKRSPEEAKKIQEEKEKSKNILREQERVIDKGVKPSEKAQAPAGGAGGKEDKGGSAAGLIKKIKKDKDVLVNLTFRSDFDATGAELKAGKDPHFEWVGYEAIIEEETPSGKTTLDYWYYKDLGGVDLTAVENTLLEAPFDEELKINGKKVDGSSEDFKELHKWMREEILPEGLKPKGHVSVHFFNLNKDPHKMSPISGTSRFMKLYTGIFMPDKAHTKWKQERQEFLELKEKGPRKDIPEWSDAAELLKDLEKDLKGVTDPKEKKHIEDEIKYTKKVMDEKELESLTDDQHFMEILKEQRKVRKPQEHVFKKKSDTMVYAAIFPVPGAEDAKFMALMNRYGLDHDPNPKMWMTKLDFKTLAKSLRSSIDKKLAGEITKLKSKKTEDVEHLQKEYAADVKEAEESLPSFLKNYVKRAEDFKKMHPLDFAAKPDSKWMEGEMAKTEPMADILTDMMRYIKTPTQKNINQEPAIHGLERGKFNSLFGHLEDALSLFHRFGTLISRASTEPAAGKETLQKVLTRRKEIQTALDGLIDVTKGTREVVKEREKASLTEEESKFLKDYEEKLLSFDSSQASIMKEVGKLIDSTKQVTMMDMERDKKFIEEQIAAIQKAKKELSAPVMSKKAADDDEEKDWQKKWRGERPEPVQRQKFSPEKLQETMSNNLDMYEKKLKAIVEKMKPVTDEDRDAAKASLTDAYKSIDANYDAVKNELKRIEEKKEDISPEEAKELKDIELEVSELRTDINEIDNDIKAKSAIPALTAARATYHAADYFSKLYGTLSRTLIFRERYVGERYAEMIEGAEEEEKEIDVPQKLLSLKKYLAKKAVMLSGLPLKAKDKIKGGFSDLKKQLNDYMDLLGKVAKGHQEEIETAKKAAGEEKEQQLKKDIEALETKVKSEQNPTEKAKLQGELTEKRHQLHSEKFVKYRINEDLLHHAQSIINKLQRHEDKKIQAMAPEAEAELKQITENIVKAYKEGFTDDKIKAMAEKKSKATGRHISYGQAAVELKKHKDVLTQVALNQFFDKWSNVSIKNKAKPERHVEQDSELARMLKALLPEVWKQETPEKEPEIPTEGVPTPKDYREHLEKLWMTEKELSHEDLIKEYKATLEEHAGGGGGGGSSGRSRAKAVRPNPPSYIGDIVKDIAVSEFKSSKSNVGPHIVDRTLAKFAGRIKKQLEEAQAKDDDAYMDPQAVLDAARDALFTMYNTLLRLKVHPGKWNMPPKSAPELSGPPDISIETQEEAEKFLKNWRTLIEELNDLWGTKKFTLPVLKYIGPKGYSSKADKKYLPFGFVDGVNDLVGSPEVTREPHPKYKGDKWSPLPENKVDVKDILKKDTEGLQSQYKVFDDEYKKTYGMLPADETNERRLKKFEDEFRSKRRLGPAFTPVKKILEERNKKAMYEHSTQLSYNVAAKFAGMELSDDEFTQVIS